MTSEELESLLLAQEQEVEALRQHLHALRLLLAGALRGDPAVLSRAEELLPALQNTAEVMGPDQATRIVTSLPPAEVSAWYVAFYEAAAAYFDKIEKGEDPGEAKAFLDAWAWPNNNCPGWTALTRDRFRSFLPLLERKGILARGPREEPS